MDTNGKISEVLKAVDQSLYFVIPTGRGCGKYEEDLQKAVTKFNEGSIIDALRDITEIVEGAVSELACKAARRGKINVSEEELKNKRVFDFEKKINILSQKEWKGKPQTRFFDVNLSTDYNSFKGARNISHHPRNRAQKARLHEQCTERMYMGTRLLREALRLMDKCR